MDRLTVQSLNYLEKISNYRLVHEYDDINLNIVWNVIQQEIPKAGNPSGKLNFK